MTTVEQSPQPSDPAQELPDYLTDPNAVLKDSDAKWRYGRAPDYSKTRDVFAKTKRMDHAAGSLPQLVENLVKNWEVEASFKPVLSDWRTVDHDKYTFAINGGPPQGADHMLKVGTYNAIIAPNDYYSPEHSDFASSHKTFKRMMPTFAWEVLEVYSGPPVVAFRWRHWGTMKNDYVGFNDKGEKITSKAHGGSIDIEGVTIAHVDNKVRLQKVETWFDPMEMFRQIAPTGVVNRVIVPKRVNTTIPFNTQPAPESDEKSTSPDLARRNSIDSQSTLVVSPQISKQEEDVDEDEFHEAHTSHNLDKHSTDPEVLVIHSTINEENAESDATSTEVVPPEDEHDHEIQDDEDASIKQRVQESSIPETSNLYKDGEYDDVVDQFFDCPSDIVRPYSKDMEQMVHPHHGEAVAVPASSEEARATHEEMSRITRFECPFLMNRE
ncbi:hypothetical protein M501DRAFT_932858 [Patellaria atrata CBS 101060]|uniref:Pathogen-related protein n=1 Tax=Patellaria atrata CBS 101060 TaxID=1346257 RepID=A0A9P4SC58_9PEZI|nr:hypothetical protein M501DRAFT_932858 [Patellaria atrata CBS 101060]